MPDERKRGCSQHRGADSDQAAADDQARRADRQRGTDSVIATPPEEWVRLEVCARDSCRWAFFDALRNRSGRWCLMAGCGNIVKMRRAYRTRASGAVNW